MLRGLGYSQYHFKFKEETYDLIVQQLDMTIHENANEI